MDRKKRPLFKHPPKVRPPKIVPRREVGIAPPAAAFIPPQLNDPRIGMFEPPLPIPFEFYAEDRWNGRGRLKIPKVRHCLYHVYPRTGSLWRTRINALLEALPLFNGKVIVAIAYDGTTEHPEFVESALQGYPVDTIRVHNDPDLREVATFNELFSRLASTKRADHCTLYAHAKGVTRPRDGICQKWVQTLEEICFRHWDHVCRLLTHYPIVGPFLQHTAEHAWHYSGSWFWFRNDRIFGKGDWQTIDSEWHGIESWARGQVEEHEAGVLFGAGKLPSMNLYDVRVWKQHVEPALQLWLEHHPSCLPETPK